MQNLPSQVVEMTQTKTVALSIGPWPEFSKLENWNANYWMGTRDELPKVPRQTLEAWRDEVDALLRPATDDEVAICITRLRANYPVFDDIPEVLQDMATEDLLDDLTGYPIEFLVEACKRWRNSTAVRAPTAGQLKAMVATEHKDAVQKWSMISGALKVCDELTKCSS